MKQIIAIPLNMEDLLNELCIQRERHPEFSEEYTSLIEDANSVKNKITLDKKFKYACNSRWIILKNHNHIEIQPYSQYCEMYTRSRI